MSAALVAGKVSVTSKCVRGTGRVACDARASIRHPRASRFTSAITMPTSPHRSRDAAWRALRDPELTASRHLRPFRTHRSTRKVQSSKSRCVERPLPSFPASARARSPPLRDATFATSTDFRRGIRRTSRGASRDATDAHLDAFAEDRRVARRSASSAAARGDLRVVRSRPSCDRSAHPEANTSTAFFRKRHLRLASARRRAKTPRGRN